MPGTFTSSRAVVITGSHSSARLADTTSLTVLEQTRKRYEFVVVGYVVMPEHIHLLISEPPKKNPSTVMQALKLGFARRVLAQARRRRNPAQASLFDSAPRHIWQKRFYDPSASLRISAAGFDAR